MTAAGFAFQLGLFTHSWRTATASAQFINRMRTPQMQRVFTEFSSQFISDIVEIPYLFRLQGIIKKRVLDVGIRFQIEQNNAGRAVDIFRAEAGIEKIADGIGNLQRQGARAGKLHLAADRIEIIFLEEDNNFIRRQRITPRFNAR